MPRRLIAPALWIVAGAALAAWAWFGPGVLDGPSRTTGLLPYLLAYCVLTVGAISLVLRLRPGGPWAALAAGLALTALAAGLALTVLVLAVPWWSAGRQRQQDVAWSATSDEADAKVVGDRLYLLRRSATDGPARLEVRDLPSGAARWGRDLPGATGEQIAAVTDDGAVLVEGSPGGRESVTRFSPQGVRQWSRPETQVLAATPGTTVLQECTERSYRSCRMQGVDVRGRTRWARTYVPGDEVERRVRDGDGPEAPAPSVVALVEPSINDTGTRVTLLDADTGQPRQQVRTAPTGADLAMARGRSVTVLSGLDGACRWQVLDATRTRTTTLPGSCPTASLRSLGPDQLLTGGTVYGPGPRAQVLDLRTARPRTMRYAQSGSTSPLVALDLEGTDPSAVDPFTGRRLWPLGPERTGQQWFVGGAVARLRSLDGEAVNPFLLRDPGRPPRQVELLAPRTGQRLAAVVCDDFTAVDSVGDDWVLVRCGDELRLVAPSG